MHGLNEFACQRNATTRDKFSRHLKSHVFRITYHVYLFSLHPFWSMCSFEVNVNVFRDCVYLIRSCWCCHGVRNWTRFILMENSPVIIVKTKNKICTLYNRNLELVGTLELVGCHCARRPYVFAIIFFRYQPMKRSTAHQMQSISSINIAPKVPRQKWNELSTPKWVDEEL